MRLTGHFYPDLKGSSRIVSALTFAFSFVVLIFLLSSSLNLFRLPFVVFACLLSVVLSRKYLEDSFVKLKPNEFFKSLCLPVKIISFCAAAFFVWEISRGLLTQPQAWDSMTYHLYFAATWVQQGGFSLFSVPGGMDGYSHFPINGEIMAAWYILPFHSDLVVNLCNFPAWLYGLFAVYAVSRECDLDENFSILAALLVLLSPMLVVLLLTSYVDIFVFSSLVAATLFFIRYEKTLELKYAVLTALSCGLAIGTKLSAFYYVLILFLLILSKSYLGIKEKKFSAVSFMKAISLAFFLAILVGGYKYLSNFFETGNPFYPFAFGGFEASAYKQKVIDEIIKKLDRAGIEAGFFSGFLSAFELNQKEILHVGSRKFFAFLLISLGAFSFLKNKKFLYFALLLLAYFPVYLIFSGTSPDIITTRMIWPHLTARLVASSLALTAVISLILLSKLKQKNAVITTLSVLVLVDLFELIKPHSHMLHSAIVTFCFALLLMLIFFKKEKLIYIFSLIILFSFMFKQVDILRTKTQPQTSEYHGSTVNKTLRKGWSWISQQPGGFTIAFATGWWQYGHNWFMYPLMGRRLENRVVYASINREEDVPTSEDSGLLREKASKKIWLNNLKKKKVDYLYLQNPKTYEHVWAEEENFELVFKSKSIQIYRIHFKDTPEP